MKNKAGKSGKKYLCRKCDSRNFRSWMQFTNHLRLCRGNIAEVKALDGKLPPPGSQGGNGIREELIQLRNLGVEVKELADSLLRRVK